MTIDTAQPAKPKLHNNGWTVFTICSYCVLIAILLLLFYPHKGDEQSISHKSKESALRANLSRLREAIGSFKSDTGVYPADLDDLVAASGQGVTAHIQPGSYQGPYLGKLPLNPYANSDLNPNHHWRYDPVTGKVSSAIDGETMDGVLYRDL